MSYKIFTPLYLITFSELYRIEVFIVCGSKNFESLKVNEASNPKKLFRNIARHGQLDEVHRLQDDEMSKKLV